ncbi:MAG: EAL domain-containing protein, partial [Rhodoferax sp.]|nr:EAL domain-containing protein [Rhodoferax sp.]
ACRVKAIKNAALLGMQSRLSINFMPNAIYQPERCIRTTLAAARAHDFPINRIIFETVEGERIEDAKWLAEVLREYQRIGFLTAIDDFGAGFAGLNLLADFQPDIIKLDMTLIRNVDKSLSRQAIVRSVERICAELGIVILAEGVETQDECLALQSLGIQLMQGYLFAKPLFEACATADQINWPAA